MSHAVVSVSRLEAGPKVSKALGAYKVGMSNVSLCLNFELLQFLERDRNSKMRNEIVTEDHLVK